jgi:hypothetical protein
MLTRSTFLGLTCVVALLWCGIFDIRSRAQQIGHTPVEVQVPRPPTPTVALGRTHLVYELHLTNFGASPATLEQIDVLDMLWQLRFPVRFLCGSPLLAFTQSMV